MVGVCPPPRAPLLSASFTALTGACQFGHGVGGFTTRFIHLLHSAGRWAWWTREELGAERGREPKGTTCPYSPPQEPRPAYTCVVRGGVCSYKRRIGTTKSFGSWAVAKHQKNAQVTFVRFLVAGADPKPTPPRAPFHRPNAAFFSPEASAGSSSSRSAGSVKSRAATPQPTARSAASS